MGTIVDTSKFDSRYRKNSHLTLTMSDNLIILDDNLKAKKIKESKVESVRNILWKYAKCREPEYNEDRQHIKDKTPVLGCEEPVNQNGDYGFFSAVMGAYNNHWALKTTPEDWFYTIIQKVAKAVDDNSKENEVRQFFVDHEVKKTLEVSVPQNTPLGVDYSWFIDQMTAKIQQNIKVDGYVELMTADFTTSSKTHQIVSGITVMMSCQEFFEYSMRCGCGIPAVIMKGTLQDWINLKTKVVSLKKMLDPIKKAIHLKDDWWEKLENICDKLIDTYNKKPGVNMWWSNIIVQTTKLEYGPSGMRRWEVPAYDGWFITEFLNLRPIKIKDLADIGSGVVTVPMKINKPGLPKPEDSTFVAGIAGYKLETEQCDWPLVSAVHSWTLLLQPNSVFRPELSAWEATINNSVTAQSVSSIGM